MIHQDLMRRKKLLLRLAMIGLILITLLIYYPPFAWAFVGDDYVQFDYIKDVIANPWLGFSLFNPYYLPWYYRPLQLIWFSQLEAIFHFVPNGFYWVALLFHTVVISLVYRVARQLKLGMFTAVLAATLFAIHSHWVDVVSWISSIAIVMAALFSLLTVSAWLSYLKRPSTRHLLLTLLFCLLTFLSHEESILLPPFLLLLLLMERGTFGAWTQKLRRSFSRNEILLFVALGLITLVYLYIQLTRPNVTIDIASRQSTDWLSFLTWPQLAAFGLVTIFRFTFLFWVVGLSGWTASLFVGSILILLGLWGWFGNRTVRLGLLWLLLHLAFIYWALWTQLPELYAGRHIYQAMPGLVLAVGATVEALLPRSSRRVQRKKWRDAQLSPQPRWLVKLLVVVVATAVSGYHLNQTQIVQRQWLANVTEEAVARQQLATLFPSIRPDNHFFAYRFPIAPQFTRSVVQLWYDTLQERPGGSLDHLRAVGEADPSFVVLDYADGQVYDMMPELRLHNKTIFLWSQPAIQVWIAENGLQTAVPHPDETLPVVAAQNGNQLAIKMTPENGRWLSRSVIITVPANSELHTAVLTQPGLRYRLRLMTSSGEEVVLWDETSSGGQNWQRIALPLDLYAGTAATVHFEVWGDDDAEDAVGYWGNPRLVVD